MIRCELEVGVRGVAAPEHEGPDAGMRDDSILIVGTVGELNITEAGIVNGFKRGVDS